jgi:hypothetical protein
MRLGLGGRLVLPVQPGVRFDAGRYLSLQSRRLERSGASARRHGATITFKDLRLLGGRRAFAWFDGRGEVLEQSSGAVLQYSLRFGRVAVIPAAVEPGKRPPTPK